MKTKHDEKNNQNNKLSHAEKDWFMCKRESRHFLKKKGGGIEEKKKIQLFLLFCFRLCFIMIFLIF